MHIHLATAAVLAFATGVVHSVLGERLIFRHLRRNSLVPRGEAPPLRARHIGILWATWHLATVFGWAGAVLLWRAAQSPVLAAQVNGPVAVAYGLAAVLVLIATRGRHPGWIALGLVALLVVMA